MVRKGAAEMKDSELKEITGGNSSEFDAIVRWIRQNDPKNYSPAMENDRILVVRWMKNNLPGFKKCSFHQDGANEYYFQNSGDDPLNNTELLRLMQNTLG